MKKAPRRDYSWRIHARYRQASWAEKGRILVEFCLNCGYQCKYAIRVLNCVPPVDEGEGEPAAAARSDVWRVVMTILVVVWRRPIIPGRCG